MDIWNLWQVCDGYSGEENWGQYKEMRPLSWVLFSSPWQIWGFVSLVLVFATSMLIFAGQVLTSPLAFSWLFSVNCRWWRKSLWNRVAILLQDQERRLALWYPQECFKLSLSTNHLAFPHGMLMMAWASVTGNPLYNIFISTAFVGHFQAIFLDAVVVEAVLVADLATNPVQWQRNFGSPIINVCWGVDQTHSKVSKAESYWMFLHLCFS